MNEILISRSLDFSDYEILIRQRGNYEYSAYSPQLNFMVSSDDIVKAKELLFKKINAHINYYMNNLDLVDEYYQKIEEYRTEKANFIAKNLKNINEENQSEEVVEVEESEDNSIIDDDNFSDLNIDELENIDSQ